MKFSTSFTILAGMTGVATAAPFTETTAKTVQIEEATVLCVQNTHNCFISVTEITATVTRQSIGVESSGHSWEVSTSRYGDHHHLEKGTIVFNPITHVEYRLQRKIDAALYKFVNGRDATEEDKSEDELNSITEARDVEEISDAEEKRDILARYNYETKVRVISISLDFTFSHNGHRYRVIENASKVKVYFAKGEKKMAREASPAPNSNGSNGNKRVTITLKTNEELFLDGHHIKLAESIRITVIQLD